MKGGIMFKDIPHSNNWKDIKPIHKGWSEDSKYHVITTQHEQMLLRISDITHLERKEYEYQQTKTISHLDINMSKPIEMGVCNQGKSMYTLYTWIEGSDAEQVLPTLTKQEQYRLGYHSGTILIRLHQFKAPSGQIPWSDYFNQKIDKKIESALECPIKIQHLHEFIEVVNTNRSYLEERPNTFQHGDYHIGNMVISEQGELGIIDFNRLSYGDPWEEFNRIVFCSRISEYFASGMINGYFEDDVPDAFFKLLQVYICNNQISSLPWAMTCSTEDVRFMMNQAKEVYDSYSGFTKLIPSWYYRNVD